MTTIVYLSVITAGFGTIEWLPDFIGPVPPSLLIRIFNLWVSITIKIVFVKRKNNGKQTGCEKIYRSDSNKPKPNRMW